MRKLLIWSVDEGEMVNYLIDPNEVEERANFIDDDHHFAIEGLPKNLTDDEIEVIKKLLKDYEKNEDTLDVYTIEELLTEKLNYNVNVNYVEDYPEFNNNLMVYFKGDHLSPNGLFELSESHFDTVKVYSYWDGSNWKEIINDGMEVVETELVVTDDFVSLDEWDGRNWVTTRYEHHDVHKVISINDEKIEDEFLLVKRSKFEREHTLGYVVTKDELIEHLSVLKRDVHKYMEDIKNLNVKTNLQKDKTIEMER